MPITKVPTLTQGNVSTPIIEMGSAYYAQSHVLSSSLHPSIRERLQLSLVVFACHMDSCIMRQISEC